MGLAIQGDVQDTQEDCCVAATTLYDSSLRVLLAVSLEERITLVVVRLLVSTTVRLPACLITLYKKNSNDTAEANHQFWVWM